MVVSYSEGKIKKIVSCESGSELVYYGSTCQALSVRLASHRRSYKTCLNNKKNWCSSYDVLQYQDAQIYLVIECSCENKEQLRRIEGKYIKEHDCVNKRIAGRTQKEYRQEYRPLYLAKNKEKIKEKCKEYYQKNKEKRAEADKILSGKQIKNI